MIELLYDLNVLYDSFQKCKSGVSWKPSVQRYEANLFHELNKLSNSIKDGTYKQKSFVEFDINERGKQRHIKSLHISDRIVQRALCDYILNPILYKYLIYDNGASVKGKGIEFTRDRLVTHLRKYYKEYGNNGYILILDYSKFFDSIPHKQLIELISKHIKDEKVLELIYQLIHSFDEYSDLDTGKSLGIGSQISQIAGIYYPTPIDNYCKIVKQCKYYGRYMDDLYIIHQDKNFLKELLTEIKIISDKLGLEINEKKTQIYKINKGFTYLKLKTFITDTGKIIRVPCKKNVVRERRKIKKLKKKMDNGEIAFEDIYLAYKSWKGSISKYNSYHIICNMDKLFNNLYRKELKQWKKKDKS